MSIAIRNFINGSDGLLQQLLSSVQEALVVTDRQHVIIYWNQAAARITGWTAAEAIGRDYLQLLPAVLAEGADETAAAGPLDSGDNTAAAVYSRKDGRTFPARVHAGVIRDERGDAAGFTITFQDLTECLQREQALKDSERRYQQMIQFAPLGVYEVDFRSERLLSINDTACQVLGYRRDELQAMNILEFFHEDSWGLYRARAAEWLQGNQPDREAEYRLVARDGSEIYVWINAIYTTDDQGNPVGASGIIQDITERKLAEMALKDTEYRYNLAVSVGRLGILDCNQVTGEVYWNDNYFRLLGYEPGSVRPGLPALAERLYPDDRSRLMAQVAREMAAGGAYISEAKLLWPDGTTHWIEVHGHTELDNRGQPQRVFALARDITHQKRGEQELGQVRERLGRVFDCSPIIMAITTVKDSVYVDVNRAWEKAFGRPRGEVIGRSGHGLDLWTDTSGLREGYQQLRREKHLYDYEMRYRNAAGEERIGLCQTDTIPMGAEEYYLHSMLDVTQQKRLEREVARLDRLNLVGEMAASIGHEIRNPMTAVRGFLQLLGAKQEYLADRPFFDLMIEEMDRANDIITEYLSMARNKMVNLKKLSLDSLINTLHPMLQSQANRQETRIKLDLNSPPDFLADESEIKQLILNIAYNGLEAMPSKGCLTISTGWEQRQVVLAISDEGAGMSPEVQAKMDIPFFTTKEDGTGLGLPVCYSIAARHGASLDFSTGPEGTTFYARFPVPG